MRDGREHNVLYIPCLLQSAAGFQEDTMCFSMNAPPEKDRKKEAMFVDGHTVNSAPHCAHTVSSHQAAERRLNGLSGDYTQINQSTVTLHHIGAVCVTQSAAAVISETCCMCPTGPPKIPCDGVRKHDSPLISPFFPSLFFKCYF